jgi:glycine/D-amino acid oxidase-like deaminating enzyme
MASSPSNSDTGPTDSHLQWGTSPWHIDFHPPAAELPDSVDFAIVGGGFTGLAAACWLRHLDPSKTVALLESFEIGAGASGRTGGLVLTESAAGDLPGLGDVLAGLNHVLDTLGIHCDLDLPGVWEIARTGHISRSPIDWKDSGSLRVSKELPGGTLDAGMLVSGLARKAHSLGAMICENHRVNRIDWHRVPCLHFSTPHFHHRQVEARKVLLATNALSLPLTHLNTTATPMLTLAVENEPLTQRQLEQIGLAERKPFYTSDLPYLWGRLRRDRSVVWGAIRVDPPEGGTLEQLDVHSPEISEMFDNLEDRIRRMHPALEKLKFRARWGGPILFREDWKPAFGWHPESRDAIVLGAFAGHGVALSNYLGAWAAEAFLVGRALPDWGAIVTP